MESMIPMALDITLYTTGKYGGVAIEPKREGGGG